MGSPYKFTDEFRKNAVAYFFAHKGELTQVQMALNLGVSKSAFEKWIKNPAYGGGNADALALDEPGPGDLEAENKRLKAENARLKEEREILKKAAAFFAKEEAGQRK